MVVGYEVVIDIIEQAMERSEKSHLTASGGDNKESGGDHTGSGGADNSGSDIGSGATSSADASAGASGSLLEKDRDNNNQ